MESVMKFIICLIKNFGHALNLAGIALLLSLSAALASADDLRIYISVDMEGLAGVVTDEQLGPGGFEYERFRQFMTDETNTAIDAAFKAGATEVVVSDSHGNGQNILIEQLPKNVTLVRSWPRVLGMMQGIELGHFDAAIFIGYHAGTTSTEGVRAHTKSSALLTDIRINGKTHNEAAINAAIAGHFGTPVIMISGDDAAVAQSQQQVGDMEGAVVKWAYSFHSARSLTPAAANELIAEKVDAAIKRLDDFKPYKLAEGPLTLEVSFKSYRPVEALSLLKSVERVNAHTIRYLGDDIIDLSTFMTFMTEYSAGLTP
jgi:D-amino peptidase